MQQTAIYRYILSSHKLNNSLKSKSRTREGSLLVYMRGLFVVLIMMPLVSTAVVKEGSYNEHQVLNVMQPFVDKHKVKEEGVFDDKICSQAIVGSQYRVEYVRTSG